MSFDEGHLGFFISQKNRHFVKNNIRIFPTTLNFKLLRYFFNNIVLRLSQSYCIIDSGRHVEFCIGTKITNSDEPSNYKHSCKVGPIVSQFHSFMVFNATFNNISVISWLLSQKMFIICVSGIVVVHYVVHYHRRCQCTTTMSLTKMTATK